MTRTGDREIRSVSERVGMNVNIIVMPNLGVASCDGSETQRNHKLSSLFVRAKFCNT